MAFPAGESKEVVAYVKICHMDLTAAWNPVSVGSTITMLPSAAEPIQAVVCWHMSNAEVCAYSHRLDTR